MHVVSSAAHLVGGLGTVLVGTWLATSGFGIALGKRLGAGAGGAPQNGVRVFARGLASAVLLGANGTLPTSAASLARRSGMGPERATLLVLGTSFGPAAMALYVFLGMRGWGVLALGLTALGIAAAVHSWRARWTHWGEATAGIALMLFGLDSISRGWIGLAPWLGLPTVDQKPFLIAVWVLLGLAGGIGLRSPGASAALFVSGAASGAIDSLSAAAALLGVLASLAASTAGHLRSGTAEERSISVAHAIFALLAALIGALVFAWGYNAPAVLLKLPGGPAPALVFLLLAALGGSAALLASLRRPLHWFLLGRLAPRVSGSRLARDLSAGCASIPALALGGLGGAVDAGAAAGRDLARKELSGAGTTEQRRRQARDAAAAAIDEIQTFRSGLEGLRWPGEAIESVLHAARSARLWHRVVELLEELAETPIPRGDETLMRRFVRLRFGALYRIEGVDEDGHEVTAEDLAHERQVFEVELGALRGEVVAACASGALESEALGETTRHLEILSELVRTAYEAVEARERVELASYRFLPELPPGAEPIEVIELVDESEEYEAEGEDAHELEPEPEAEAAADDSGGRYRRIGGSSRRSATVGAPRR